MELLYQSGKTHVVETVARSHDVSEAKQAVQ